MRKTMHACEVASLVKVVILLVGESLASHGLPVAMLDFCVERLHLGDISAVETGRRDALNYLCWNLISFLDLASCLPNILNHSIGAGSSHRQGHL